MNLLRKTLGISANGSKFDLKKPCWTSSGLKAVLVSNYPGLPDYIYFFRMSDGTGRLYTEDGYLVEDINSKECLTNTCPAPKRAEQAPFDHTKPCWATDGSEFVFIGFSGIEHLPLEFKRKDDDEDDTYMYTKDGKYYLDSESWLDLSNTPPDPFQPFNELADEIEKHIGVNVGDVYLLNNGDIAIVVNFSKGKWVHSYGLAIIGKVEFYYLTKSGELAWLEFNGKFSGLKKKLGHISSLHSFIQKEL